MNIYRTTIKSSVMKLSVMAVSMLSACSTLTNREVIVASNCADRGPITLAEVKLLEDGQSPDQVNAVFGCTGVLRQGVVGKGPFTIEWSGGAGGSTSVMVIFIDGLLNSDGVQKYGF